MYDKWQVLNSNGYLCHFIALSNSLFTFRFVNSHLFFISHFGFLPNFFDNSTLFTYYFLIQNFKRGKKSYKFICSYLF
jgi:hypothetical protein